MGWVSPGTFHLDQSMQSNGFFSTGDGRWNYLDGEAANLVALANWSPSAQRDAPGFQGCFGNHGAQAPWLPCISLHQLVNPYAHLQPAFSDETICMDLCSQATLETVKLMNLSDQILVDVLWERWSEVARWSSNNRPGELQWEAIARQWGGGGEAASNKAKGDSIDVSSG